MYLLPLLGHPFSLTQNRNKIRTLKTTKSNCGFIYSLLFNCLIIFPKQMELPEWTDIVKTGVLKELAPYDPDWYYVALE